MHEFDRNMPDYHRNAVQRWHITLMAIVQFICNREHVRNAVIKATCKLERAQSMRCQCHMHSAHFSCSLFGALIVAESSILSPLPPQCVNQPENRVYIFFLHRNGTRLHFTRERKKYRKTESVYYFIKLSQHIHIVVANCKM